MKQFWKVLCLAVTVLCFTLTAVPAQPVQAAMIGEEREIEMGRAAGQQLEREYGVYQDPGQQARLERIGRSLAAQCERRNLPFQFKILNTPEVNALACPGGFIYVFKGLLDYMPDDAELAGVLGHEIGHVAKRHTVKQIEKNMWTQMASILAGIATGSADVMMAGMVVTDALAAGYSRADESAADRCGFEYALKAGYSPYGILITMYKLQQLSGEYGNPGWGLFDSHPEPEERVRRMKGLLETLQVTPQPVANADGTADVVETHDGRTWRFTFTGPANGNKAEYRADILAGALYQVKRRGPVQPERFIVYDRGGEATVFYDDLQLLTVTKQDAGSRSPADYAKQAAAGFREWAVLANAERAGNPQAFTIDPFSKKDRNKEKGKEKGNGKEKDTDRKTGVTKNVQAK
ncbi:MAG: M48 family metalloprotease [Acidaminococcaceae bacterium]|nr:M48 family metalloprotease [Acidaminococcaceae bacterium]